MINIFFRKVDKSQECSFLCLVLYSKKVMINNSQYLVLYSRKSDNKQFYIPFLIWFYSFMYCLQIQHLHQRLWRLERHQFQTECPAQPSTWQAHQGGYIQGLWLHRSRRGCGEGLHLQERSCGQNLSWRGLLIATGTQHCSIWPNLPRQVLPPDITC